MQWNAMIKSKTFWSAVAAIVAAVGSAACKAISWQEAAAAVWVAAQTVFVRDAVARGTQP